MTRHFWVLVHRYAGLYMAFFLIVAGLTGSILAFDGEIRDWLNPPVKVALRAEPQLDELTLRERALALAPHGQISGLSFNRNADEAYVAHIEPRTDPATGEPYDLAFNTLVLDPYTGAELARENELEDLWPITRQNFVSVMVALHYRLAVPGSIGIWLFGIAALLWTIDCFVSFYLTLPRRRNAHSPPLPQAGEGRKSWWARWKPAWLVKWSGSAYRINFDLHRAGGLWVWLLLLVLAWSSVGFNLGSQIYTPVMKAVFNMPDVYGDIPVLETPQPEPGLTWREAHRIGRQLMAEQAGVHGFRVQREEYLSYYPEKGVFIYVVHSDRDVSDESGGTLVVFNGNSGRFAGLLLPSGLNAGTTLNEWIFALHIATIWGVPYKVFLSGVGILIAVLSVTGVIIWWRKRRSRQYRTARLALRRNP